MYTFLDTLRQALIIICSSVQCFCVSFKVFWKDCFDETCRKFSLSPQPCSGEDSDLNPVCQHDTGDSNQNHITQESCLRRTIPHNPVPWSASLSKCEDTQELRRELEGAQLSSLPSQHFTAIPPY